MKMNSHCYDAHSKHPSRRLLLLPQLPLLALLLASSLLAAGKLSSDLQSVPPDSRLDVIIQFSQPPAAADLTAIARMGGSVKKTFEHIPGVLITVPAAA